jgi:DNA polymerase-4
VAKIASQAAKPDGLLEVPPERVAGFLAPLPVTSLPGVGPETGAVLQCAGFSRVGELAAADPARLEALLGGWRGQGLARLARGEDLSPVEPWREPVSYSEENTFAADVEDRATVERTIRAHAESVARRLRRDGLRARTVVLKLKLAGRTRKGPRGFPVLTRRATLPAAIDDGEALARAALALLARARPPGRLRLVGVGATGLVAAGAAEQLPLFGEPAAAARRARLNRALDRIRDRFGAGALVRGGLGEVPRAGLSQLRKRGED